MTNAIVSMDNRKKKKKNHSNMEGDRGEKGNSNSNSSNGSGNNTINLKMNMKTTPSMVEMNLNSQQPMERGQEQVDMIKKLIATKQEKLAQAEEPMFDLIASDGDDENEVDENSSNSSLENNTSSASEFDENEELAPQSNIDNDSIEEEEEEEEKKHNEDNKRNQAVRETKENSSGAKNDETTTTNGEEQDENKFAAFQRKTINIMNNLWKTRPDRESLNPDDHSHEKASLWRRILTALMADISFALGYFRGGDLVGPPRSVQQMFSEKVEIVPTQSPSEGFERSCSYGEDIKLDPSLQLISKRMKEILGQIEGRCRMSAVRFLGWILGKLWAALFSEIHVDAEGIEKVRRDLQVAAKAGSSVMLLPTHRSHIDYLLMSYVCFGFNLPVPHIASGDNLNIPVIGQLFSYSGAFFLRRSFRGDNLYKKVLYTYLLRKLREGAPVEVFVEGGRSRTGMISDPKLGMILMAVRFVRDGSVPDIMLLPSSIDYERVLETTGHVDQLLGSKKKGETLLGALKSGFAVLRGNASHGSVHVNFSDGISVKQVIEQVEAPLKATSSRYSDHHFVPEEAYVSAVAQAVVSGQREASFITGGGLVAASLLGVTDGSAFALNGHDHEIFRNFQWIWDLVRKAGGNTLAADIVATDAQVDKVIRQSLVVLGPLIKVPKQRKDKGNSESRSKTNNSHNNGGNQRNEDIDGVAKQRLRLRYSCGQLLPVLGAHCVVATALYSLTGGNISRPVKLEALIRCSSSVAELARYSLPGAKLDSKRLRKAVFDLVGTGALDQATDGGICVSQSDPKESDRLLRVLRVLVGPALSACYACMAASLSFLAEQQPIHRDKLTEKTREIIYAQIRGEPSSNELLSLSEGGEPMVGFPEALSMIEIRSAIKSLLSLGIFSSYGSNGVSPTHSPSGSLAGISVPSSQMSMISVASSRTFLSETADKKSTNSGNSNVETQSTAAAEQKAKESYLEISPLYAKDKGTKLFERLSILQRHLYRDEKPQLEIPSVLPSKVVRTAAEKAQFGGIQRSNSNKDGVLSLAKLKVIATALLLTGTLVPVLKSLYGRKKR